MKDRKVLIVGMGRSGRAAVGALIEKGAEVSIQDSKNAADFEPEFLEEMRASNVKEYLGCVPEDLSAFDMLVLSPGVPPRPPSASGSLPRSGSPRPSRPAA